MTKDEARAAAIAAGIKAEDCTDEVLADFGYEAPDPTAAVTPQAPAVSDAAVNADNAADAAEAQANTTGAQVVEGLKAAAGVAEKVAGVALKA